MLDLNNLEIRFVIEAVRRAANLIAVVQQEMITPALTKEDRSPVTVADYASQALVSRMLLDSFPQDPLVAEEDAGALRSAAASDSLERITRFVHRYFPRAVPDEVCAWIDRGSATTADRFWTLDPIDGTKGFLRGDQYAVALALLVDGEVEVAALGCPNLTAGYQPDPGGPGSLVVAAKGQGTWTITLEEAPFTEADFQRLEVSDREDASQARLLRSYVAEHTNVDKVDDLADRLGVSVEPVRMDSQAKYAVLAAGHGELSLRLLSPKKPDYREKIWDQAAGSLLAKEAGGKVTDLRGEALDFTRGRTLARNRGILASNGRLHEAALRALSEVGAAS